MISLNKVVTDFNSLEESSSKLLQHNVNFVIEPLLRKDILKFIPNSLINHLKYLSIYSGYYNHFYISTAQVCTFLDDALKSFRIGIFEYSKNTTVDNIEIKYLCIFTQDYIFYVTGQYLTQYHFTINRIDGFFFLRSIPNLFINDSILYSPRFINKITRYFFANIDNSTTFDLISEDIYKLTSKNYHNEALWIENSISNARQKYSHYQYYYTIINNRKYIVICDVKFKDNNFKIKSKYLKDMFNLTTSLRISYPILVIDTHGDKISATKKNNKFD